MPDPVIAGTGLTYTITVTNAGPSDAHAVTVTDSLPAGLSDATYTLDGGPSTPWTGTLVLGTMIPGETHTIVISATVDADVPLGTTLVNNATVSSSTSDPEPGNNDATATTTVDALADLSVTKTDGESRASSPASRPAPTRSLSPTPVRRTPLPLPSRTRSRRAAAPLTEPGHLHGQPELHVRSRHDRGRGHG